MKKVQQILSCIAAAFAPIKEIVKQESNWEVIALTDHLAKKTGVFRILKDGDIETVCHPVSTSAFLKACKALSTRL